MVYQGVENLPIAASLQKVQTLTYISIRIDLELLLLLALGIFERPAQKVLFSAVQYESEHKLSLFPIAVSVMTLRNN